jgi:hypothetical protein
VERGGVVWGGLEVLRSGPGTTRKGEVGLSEGRDAVHEGADDTLLVVGAGHEQHLCSG